MKTILLVVVAIFAVGFVYVFITGQLGDEGDSSKLSVFASVFKRGEKDDPQKESSTEETPDQVPQVQEGFNEDPDGHIYFYRDGVVLKACWLDYQSCLYYFDEQGFACVTELAEGAFLYHFSSRGEVTAIEASAEVQSTSAGTDTPGLVRSGSLLVYLNPDSCLGRFQQIQYKKSAVSHALGTEEGAEYALPGTLQIDAEGYVYWLPYVSDPDEMEKKINGTLYRKLPGTEVRQFVARNVTGYKVLTGENDRTVIYYCSGSKLFKCGTESCREDESVIGFTEEMAYRLRISDDGKKLYLETESGYPVTKESEAFHTGGMTYSLSGDGEILSVKGQDCVTVGDYTYLSIAEDLYGMKRSVIVRQKGEEKETISSEFTGECGNLYYCADDCNIYAEYTFMDGRPHIAVIGLDGDVDLLIGGNEEVSAIRICGFDEETVIIKYVQEDGSVSYDRIRKAETTPLGVAVDPVPFEQQTETGIAQEGIAPGTISGPGGQDTESSSTSAAEYYGPGYDGEQTAPNVGPGGVSTDQVTGMEPGQTVIP